MRRYFLEVIYRGTGYAGFQVQENAVTIQWEVEKALAVYFREKISLTGSSRTDTGVHARQNYFHFDTALNVPARAVYNLNALLPQEIAIRRLVPVRPEAHCRFDALWREYEYTIYQAKDPFLADRAYYYPYTLNLNDLQQVAAIIPEYQDFTSFSKRNSQVKTFQCQILHSGWEVGDGYWLYRVRANRFLRGMVRGLVGTMLQVGRGKITTEDFRNIVAARDCTKADFAVPGHGLQLVRVEFPENYFMEQEG